MIVSFVSFVREDDYNTCNKFRMKMSKANGLYFFVCVIMGAVALYNILTTKNYGYIMPFIFFVLIAFVSWLNEAVIKPKKQIKNLKKNVGDFAFAARKVTIYQNAIEFEPNETAENQPYVQGIYPFSTLAAVYETDDAYYFFITSSQMKFVMKRDIPSSYHEAITSAIKSNCLSYRAVK